ncbi:hypothetical protein [Hymenobacter sp. BT559]|uniref:hypothetical protein n=1 Tax=Hymenobacter sp. BT559 TaxID=2795729 RepID=UPI0018ED66D3|nr:hypothetical protein [Hymenobacter sp. BT559]MBJ6145465.1 hypothetical protein [Hymenobacter sp. BT559]
MRFLFSWLALLPAVALLGMATHQPAAHLGGPKLPPPGKIKSVYVATPPTIDGKTTEWTDSLQYDNNSKLQYQVLNDTRTMYLRLKANDASTQARFVYLGMVIWLDTTGRNQQQLGIRFPLPIDLESLPRGEQRPAGAMGPSAAERLAEHQTRLRQVLLGAKEMELLNFRGNKEPVLTDAQSQLGIKAALDLDAQGNLIYELAVPLRLIYRRVPTLATGQAATVGVTLAGMKPKMPKSDSSNDPYSAMNGGGMGGYGRMGGMGGMRGMRGGGPQYSYSPLSLRTSAQLAGQ